MKKIATLALLAVTVPSVVSSCISQMEMSEKTAGRVRLSAEIEDKVSTRVDESGFCDGDSFGVFVVNFVDAGTPGDLADQGNQVDNVRFTFHETDNTWIPATTVTYKDASTMVDIYGYYPYDANLSDVHAYRFSVNTDQRKAAVAGQMGGYEASDFLYGTVKSVVPSENTVSILFKHKMSSVSVSLTKGKGWESDAEWQAASKDILIGNTVVDAAVDLGTGTVTPAGEVSRLDIVPKQLGSDAWKAVVVPQTIPAGKELVIVTVNGFVSAFTKDSEYQYHQGKMNTITLAVSKKSPAEGIALELVAESILPWEDAEFERDVKDYLLIHCPEAGKLEETMTAAGYDLATIRNLKITGKIDARDFFVMNTKMSNLEALNLADALIAAYENEENTSGLPPFSHESDCIPASSFQEKTSLCSIVLPKKLREIKELAFSGTSLRGSLIIPEGTVRIESSAFSEIPTLNAQVVFPSTLRTIGGGAFFSTTVRGELHFPNKLREIGGGSFRGTSISGRLCLPDSLEFIGDFAFHSCSGLTGSLIIPEKIKEIPFGCFERCGFDGELVLNENLETIGNYALQWCGFTGPLVLPKSLKEINSGGLEGNHFSSLVIESSNLRIGDRAFYSSLEGGDVEIPEGITSIGPYAFLGCAIESVRFPKSLEYVGAEAFDGCFHLSSIECKATTPPQLGTNAFEGVPKDNFVLVVPSSAVDEYQSADGWNEFNRIEAYRDFSISRRLYRTLNASAAKSFTLRAESGASWSVQEKPDWVTVEPASGTGKTEIRVTVAALPHGSGNRSGEIVYRLGSDGYTVSTLVEQYDSPYADGDVLVNHAHTKGSGIPLVFLGDGYDAKDISEGKYTEDINEAIGHLFAIEPYKSHKDYFDVSTVIARSEESGIQYANVIRDTRFKTTYTRKSGLVADEDVCDEYALKALSSLNEKTHVALICNTPLFTGKTYLYPDKRSISICPVVSSAYPYDFRGVIQHEIGGHGFGKLGDERIDYYGFIQTNPALYEKFLKGKSYGWYDNLSLTDDIKGVPWSHMVFDPDYSDLVDVYEGGYFFSRGVFRSEANSCMNNYVPYFSSISRESIVRRIMEYAGEPFSYESFKEKDKQSNNN